MPMNINRRELLQILGASALLSSCGLLNTRPTDLPIESHETIFSGYRVGEAYVSTNAGIHMGSTNQNQRIQLKNEIHSVLYSPKHNVKVFVPKLELYAYAQLGHGEIFPIEAGKGNYFYGHGAIDEKRNCVYFSQARITESRDDTDRSNIAGFIYTYSLPDFKFLGQFSSFGNDPHDLKIFNDQLLVCNGGQDSRVSVIDLESKKFVRDYRVRIKHLSLRHIDQMDEENFSIAPLTSDSNKPCPLYNLNLKTGLKPYIISPQLEMALLRFQLLSVLNFGEHVFATCPMTDSLIVWDRNGKFIGGAEIPSASNLAISKKLNGVIVGSGFHKEKARLVKIVNNQISIEKISWGEDISGAHSLIVTT